MFSSIKKLFKAIFNFIFYIPIHDPVYSCPVYLDVENGSCAHVDGPHCTFPNCNIIDVYKEQKLNYVPTDTSEHIVLPFKGNYHNPIKVVKSGNNYVLTQGSSVITLSTEMLQCIMLD